MGEQEEVAIVVGAGPAGLAAAACLGKNGVPCLVLERDDCVGSLWRNRCYDRLHLHLEKRFVALPHAPHPPTSPSFIDRAGFVEYLDEYAAKFQLRLRFGRRVVDARFEPRSQRWILNVEETKTRNHETYTARYLVVASGENDTAVLPSIAGMENFSGTTLHTREYRSGAPFNGKSVLVIGCGNSGFEIALDLAEAGAMPSIVVRSEVHLVTKEIWFLAMMLLKWLPAYMIDAIVLLLCWLVLGDTSKYGLRRPAMGPMTFKLTTPYYPVFDQGTLRKIKQGHVKVVPALRAIEGNDVIFSDGQRLHFDAIIFATGYKSGVKEWLKEPEEELIGEDGMAKQKYPGHWKGRNGLYCVGLARKGVYGLSEDALLVADDIGKQYDHLPEI